MRVPISTNERTDDGSLSRFGSLDLSTNDRRECELCERRTWCHESYGMVVCDVCDDTHLP